MSNTTFNSTSIDRKVQIVHNATFDRVIINVKEQAAFDAASNQTTKNNSFSH